VDPAQGQGKITINNNCLNKNRFMRAHLKTVITVFLVLIYILSADAQIDSLQKEIDEQVWKPFITSFNQMDTEKFMALHSRNMIRVGQDNNYITGYEGYYQSNKSGNESSKKNYENNKGSHKIELRFVQRIAADGRAFEVGYYKVTRTLASKTGSFYGKFHVLLQKENNQWKIIMDADAKEKTDEAIFLTGRPIE
jgi:hypothetical protein